MSIGLVLVLAAAASLLVSCGDDSAEPTRELITWSAGDLDAFGCPYVSPTPWVSQEVHEQICGEGCDPLELVDINDVPNSDFVACVSPDLPGFPPHPPGSPPQAVLQSAICVTHPVTREELLFPDSRGGAFRNVCWGPCEFLLDLTVQELPDECYEQVDPQ